MPPPTPRLYFYKMRNDNGGAPCVYHNLLSLGICKPVIRRTAKPGDWLFGFGGVELGERLIYVAQVTEKLGNGDYYRDLRHTTRPDCIYKWQGEALKIREDARYHPGGGWAEMDIGAGPVYNKAIVLLARRFVYFGKRATADYQHEFPAVAKAIGKLTQGHRVNHETALHKQLLSLRDQVFALHGDCARLAEPYHARSQHCEPSDRGLCEVGNPKTVEASRGRNVRC